MTLNDFLVSEIFTFLLIFCRVGTALMILPGFGEAFVSARVRLLLALMFSLVLTPALPDFPAPPSHVFTLMTIMMAEILTGIFFGMLGRLMLAAISTAGMIIAYQAGLASALVQDVTIAGGQASSLGNLLGITAMALLFATNMHHLMLQALMDSYQIFPVGQFPNVEDFTWQAAKIVNSSFLISLQIAAPHIVIGLVVYLAGGITGRLMPSLQVFFILLPPQLILSFFVLMVAWSSIMMWYMDYFRDGISQFVGQ
ncbi:MAG: flagellar biosynthetic protein FliR [Alphaproteobacteria bacterium]|nr:flagellar biosynthetic protein FliR [Alphaproteobacteria bacterium]